MGVSSSHGTARSRRTRRTIWFTFAAMVAGPVACLVVLWGLILGGVFGGAMGGPDTPEHDHQVVVNFVVVVGIGLAIIVAGVALMGFFARRLARDITDLRRRPVPADEEAQARKAVPPGEQGVVPAEVTLQLRTKTAEVASAEAAIASLQHTAAAAAAGEAGLRNGIGQVFVSLARRNQSLLQRQLRLIDALEQKASDPAALADLFPLDHLTTRMRRHAEGLIILSGEAPGRFWSEPVPVIDVIRGAVAEIEDYKRVTVLTRAEDAVTGLAAADGSLLAELIRTRRCPRPPAPGSGRAQRVANGFAIEIDDRGLGIEADAAYDQQAAGPAARLRPCQRRPARPVCGGQARRPARGAGRAPAVCLRRHHGGGDHAQQHRGARGRRRDGHESRPAPADRQAVRPGPGRPRHARPGRPAISAANASVGPTGETGNAGSGSGLAPGSTGAALRPPGFAPRQPRFAPSRPTFAPAQRGLAPSQPGPAPSQPRPVPRQDGPAPSQPGPRQDGPAPSQRGFAPGQPDFGSGSSTLSQDSAARAGPRRGHRHPRSGGRPADRRHLPWPSAPGPPGEPEPASERQPGSSRPGEAGRQDPAIQHPEPGGGTQPRRFDAKRLAARPCDECSGRGIRRCSADGTRHDPRPRTARRHDGRAGTADGPAAGCRRPWRAHGTFGRSCPGLPPSPPRRT